jgi:SHS2 domain-containing protein
MIEAHGRTIGEAFAFAATAMFDVMFDVSKVNPKTSMKIEVEATDNEGLLYSWLEELLFKFEVEKKAFSKFRFSINTTDRTLKGTGEAQGETYNPDKHGRKTEVKAITYAEMSIDESETGCKVRFVVDI